MKKLATSGRPLLTSRFGDATDGWRIEQIWALYQQGIQFTNTQGWTDWWVFWRRVAGGLNQEQQETLLADIAKYLHPGAMRTPASTKEAQEKGYEAWCVSPPL